MVKTVLSEREKKIAERIRIIIDEFCDGKQSVFSQRTGIPKGTVSHYVNGKNIPSEAYADVISRQFGVSKAWLFGFNDTNMKSGPDELDFVDLLRMITEIIYNIYVISGRMSAAIDELEDLKERCKDLDQKLQLYRT